MKLVIIFFLLISSLIADDDEKGYHHYYSKDLTYLHLTYEQKKDLKDILKEYRHDIKKYKKYKKKIVKEKQELFEKDTLNTEELKRLNHKVTRKASAIEIEFLEKIHKVLSEKQREKFINFIDDWEIE